MAVGPNNAGRGSETETKASFKTSELLAYVLVLVLILIAANTISAEDGRTDWFRADQAWLYITVLTVGYMVSRGLAKSGSREPAATGHNNGGSPIGERVTAAVTALKGESAGEGSGRAPTESLEARTPADRY